MGGGACNPPGPAAYPQAESPRPAPSTRRAAWPAWTGWGRPWPGRWSQAPLRVGPGPGRPRRCPSVPQRLVDEQLSRKQTLYALCFGAAARALWPDPVDVSASA